MKNRVSLIILFCLLLGIVACSNDEEEGLGEVAETATAVAATAVVPATTTPEPTGDPTVVPSDTPTKVPTEAPTNTPEPTAIPTNTPTAIPTDTAVPTDIPDEASFGALVSAHYADLGLTFQHPFHWAVDNLSDFLVISSPNFSLISQEITEGGYIVLIPTSELIASESNPILLLENLISFNESLNLLSEPTIVQESERQVTVTAVIDGSLDELEIEGMAAIVQAGQQGFYIVAYSPTEDAIDYSETFETIIHSIKVSEPIVIMNDATDEEEADPNGLTFTTGGAQSIDIGESFQHLVPNNRYQEYIFTGSQGTTIFIVLEPLNFDPILELYDLGDHDNPLISVDQGSTGESEVMNFVLPKDGAYAIRVQGFGNAGGDYRLSVQDGGVDAVRPLLPGSTASTIDQNHITYQLAGVAGVPFIIWVDPLSDDVDVKLVLKESSGDVLRNMDRARLGEREYVTFTPEADDLYYLEIHLASGSAIGDFELTWLDLETAVIETGNAPINSSVNYNLCLPADETVLIFVSPAPGFDAIVTLEDQEGVQLVDPIDDGLVSQPELVYYENPTSTASPLIVNIKGFGGIGGDFIMVVLGLGETAVIQDGC